MLLHRMLMCLQDSAQCCFRHVAVRLLQRKVLSLVGFRWLDLVYPIYQNEDPNELFYAFADYAFVVVFHVVLGEEVVVDVDYFAAVVVVVAVVEEIAEPHVGFFVVMLLSVQEMMASYYFLVKVKKYLSDTCLYLYYPSQPFQMNSLTYHQR